MAIWVGLVAGGWVLGWLLFPRAPRLRSVSAAEASVGVDVVVPADGPAPALPVLLRALAHQRHLARRVVVVGSGTAATRAADAGATVLRPRPLPAGRSRPEWVWEEGLAATSAPLVIRLEPDTVPAPDLLGRLASEEQRLGGTVVVLPDLRPAGVGARLTAVAAVVTAMVWSGVGRDAESAAPGAAVRRDRARGARVHLRFGPDGVLTGSDVRGATARRLRHALHLVHPVRIAAIAVWLLALAVAVALLVAAAMGAGAVAGVAPYVPYALCSVQVGVLAARRGRFGAPVWLLYPVALLVGVAVLIAALATRERGSTPTPDPAQPLPDPRP